MKSRSDVSRAARRAVAAATSAARRTAQADPIARGADWRGATVGSVGTDGTVTTTDGIIARRMASYQSPAVGDRIHISRNGAGNWRADGPVANSTAPNGAWTNLPLASGFSSPHAPFQTAQYRLIDAWGTPRVELRGSIDAATSVQAQTAFTTALPAAIVPSFNRSFAVRRVFSTATLGVIAVEISAATQVLSVFGSSTAATTWFTLDGCSYDL